MTTTVGNLLSQMATMVQEDGSSYGGSDWSSGLWTPSEIIGYINVGCKQFILDSQIMKLIAPVASVTGQRLYADPTYTMQLDRIAFNNRPLYRTTRTMLDRDNPRWPVMSGVPRQYHQDQLPTKEFEVDRAPTSAMTGTGYTAVGLYGTLRYMIHALITCTDGNILNGSQNFFSNTLGFLSTDVGKILVVIGAGVGGQPLVTTVSVFNSATSVILAAAASTTVSGASASLQRTVGFYTATIPSVGHGGILRYTLGSPAINAVLLNSPAAGTLRQMLSGLTNFEVLATRLTTDVSVTTDVLRVPDFCVLYIKLWVLQHMLEKEGEGQDLPRAKYCGTRYNMGVRLFRRLMSAMNDNVVPPQAVAK